MLLKTDRILLVFVILLAQPVLGQQRGLKVVARLPSGQEMALYDGSYAVVIGVSEYDYWPDLPATRGDVDQVSAALRSRGFAVKTVYDPDSERLEGELEDLEFRGGVEHDRLLFYFAGHGDTETLAGGEELGYIVPRDAPLQSTDPRGFVEKAVSMKRIEECVERMRFKHALFIFDSCFSGSIFTLQREAPKNISEKCARPVRQFITAGGSGETVPDESVFREALLEALAGDGDLTEDGYITGTELGLYLGEKVVGYSEGTQHPQAGKLRHPKLDDGDFVFMASPTAQPVETEPVPPPPPAVQFGHLQVNANAPDSRVSVDGSFRGTAGPGRPLNLENFGRGQVRIEVTAEGYEPATQSARLQPGEWTQVVLELEPEPAPVRPEPVPLPPGDQESRPEPAVTLPGQSLTARLPGGATMEFVWIEPGTFTMGSSQKEIEALIGTHLGSGFTNEGPRHQVTIRRGYYLGKYEITQEQWEAVMGTAPWSGKVHVQPNPNHPAVYTSWEDVQEFMQRLNTAAGEELYRLPTEAEWEFACRAGTTTWWSFGDDEGDLGAYAWYEDNAWNAGLQYAQPVGTRLPNPWGLHDMHGNVFEWCQDWFGPYSDASQEDPTGPPSGFVRVVRGGFLSGGARHVRSACRYSGLRVDRVYHVGARLVRTR